MAPMDEMNDGSNDRYSDDDLPEISDPEIMMFEGMPVTGQGFKITGVAGSVNPRRQFKLAALPSGTHVSGTWEGIVEDIIYEKVKGKKEMTRIHKVKVGDDDVVSMTHILSDLDDE